MYVRTALNPIGLDLMDLLYYIDHSRALNPIHVVGLNIPFRVR